MEEKSWFICVALSVAIRYMSAFLEETWSNGPNGPYGILVGRECPCVAMTWAWISRLSIGEMELRRRRIGPIGWSTGSLSLRPPGLVRPKMGLPSEDRGLVGEGGENCDSAKSDK
jgi:hypothetical protein